jgi:hypothetical protein
VEKGPYLLLLQLFSLGDESSKKKKKKNYFSLLVVTSLISEAEAL